MEQATNRDFLPWDWSITAADPSVCPSSTAILGTFAIVNVVISLAGVITGNRLVLRFLTCGCLGSKEYSRSWQLLWLIPFSLQLGANGAIAVLMTRVPGYVATFSIGQLVVFYTARPRLAWVVIGALSLRSRTAPPSMDRSARSRDRWEAEYNYYGPKTLPSYWHNAAMSQIVAEIFLQLIALYVMGTTVRFAATRGYYVVGSEAYSTVPPAARIMYAGAMWYLVTGTSQLLPLVLWIFPFTLRSRRGPEDEPSESHRTYIGAMLAFGFLFTWVSAWLFWAGFLGLAGTLYCPPKLVEQGAIWVGASIAGILGGSGG